MAGIIRPPLVLTHVYKPQRASKLIGEAQTSKERIELLVSRFRSSSENVRLEVYPFDTSVEEPVFAYSGNETRSQGQPNTVVFKVQRNADNAQAFIGDPCEIQSAGNIRHNRPVVSEFVDPA